MNVFTRILAVVTSIDKNNLQSSKNWTTNAVKPVWKQANERLRPYVGTGTFDWLKITSKVQKMEQQMP